MGSERSTAGTSATSRAAPQAADKPYWLCKHVHLCTAQGHVVLLDLKRDKYLAVASPEELAPWISGWPIGSSSGMTITPGDAGEGPDSKIPPALSRLFRDGLLTLDPACGTTRGLPAMRRPISEFVRFEFNHRPHVNPLHTVAVGRAWLTARIALKRLSMESLVERVQERKARAGRPSWDVARARDLVTAFLRMRPLYYSPRDACLLDSLVMMELLAKHSIFPTWVFGVQMAPFSAHCWIQHEDAVWNDTPERTAAYSPILCI